MIDISFALYLGLLGLMLALAVASDVRRRRRRHRFEMSSRVQGESS